VQPAFWKQELQRVYLDAKMKEGKTNLFNRKAKNNIFKRITLSNSIPTRLQSSITKLGTEETLAGHFGLQGQQNLQTVAHGPLRHTC
jgi:predicted patatin/cPLA2 family phospholipase